MSPSIIKDMVYMHLPWKVYRLHMRKLCPAKCAQGITKSLATFRQRVTGESTGRAISNRQDLPVRGNMTNHFCEAAMRVLKDQILHRTKEFNVQQLLDFIMSRMEAYYQRRCLYVANPGTLFMDQSNSTPYNVFQRKNLNENQPTNGSKNFWKILFELSELGRVPAHVWIMFGLSRVEIVPTQF